MMSFRAHMGRTSGHMCANVQYGAQPGLLFASTEHMAEEKGGQSDRAGRYRVHREGYRAFLPKPLPPDPGLRLDAELQALLSHADQALGRLDGAVQILPNPDLFVLMFVRREAVLSSQIEGTQSSLRDLLRAEANIHDPDRPADVAEVVNYVSALNHGVRALSSGRLSIPLMLALHRRLLSGLRGSDLFPGEFRTDIVWIGSPGASLNDATFVPPPPEAVPGCMEALERFVLGRDSLPALVKAGLVHAQFETIHPFFDGNGRVGRQLIALSLCEAGILQKPVLYLSHYLKARRTEYYQRLQAVRDAGAWEDWLKFLIAGVASVAIESTDTARAIVALREEVREDLLATLGRGAANALRLHERLFETPIVGVKQVGELLDLGFSAANRLIDRMVERGVLVEVTGHARNRRFAYHRYIELFDD